MRSEARTVGLEVNDLFIIGGCVETTKQQQTIAKLQRNERVPNAFVIS